MWNDVTPKYVPWCEKTNNAQKLAFSFTIVQISGYEYKKRHLQSCDLFY